jgi:hypothetical protein
LNFFFSAENQIENNFGQPQSSTFNDKSISTNTDSHFEDESPDLVIAEDSPKVDKISSTATENLRNFENDETRLIVSEVRSLSNEIFVNNSDNPQTESEKSKTDSSTGVSLFLPR